MCPTLGVSLRGLRLLARHVNTGSAPTVSSPAIRHSGVPTLLPNGTLWFVGRDTGRRLTEVGPFVAAEGDDLVIVFHALPLGWTR